MCFIKRSQNNSNIKSNLYETVRLALLKPQNHRDKQEELAVEKHMIKINFFQNLKERKGYQQFQDFCRNLFYKVADTDEKIITQGHFGEYFYVLLQGQVRVLTYYPKNKQASQQIFLQQSMINKGKFIPVDYENTDLFDVIELASLKEGTVFGEMALLHHNALTSATIIAKMPCQFAVMDKDTFWKYSGKDKQDEFDMKLNQLRTIPFLQDWSDIDIKSISYDFRVRSFVRSQIIYREGERNQGLYFIINGEVTIRSNFQKDMKKSQNIQFLVRKMHLDKEISVCILGENQVFGDETGQNYQYTAICSSLDLSVYFITKYNLDRRLAYNTEARKVLQNTQKVNESWRIERTQNLIKKELQNDAKNSDQIMVEKFLNIPKPMNLNSRLNNKSVNRGINISTTNSQFLKIDFLSANEVIESDLILQQDIEKNFYYKKKRILPKQSEVDKNAIFEYIKKQNQNRKINLEQKKRKRKEDQEYQEKFMKYLHLNRVQKNVAQSVSHTKNSSYDNKQMNIQVSNFCTEMTKTNSQSSIPPRQTYRTDINLKLLKSLRQSQQSKVSTIQMPINKSHNESMILETYKNNSIRRLNSVELPDYQINTFQTTQKGMFATPYKTQKYDPKDTQTINKSSITYGSYSAQQKQRNLLYN